MGRRKEAELLGPHGGRGGEERQMRRRFSPWFRGRKVDQPCETSVRVATGHFYRQIAVDVELGLNVTEQVEERWRGEYLRVLIRACFSR